MQEKRAIVGHAALRSSKAGLAFVLEFASRVFLAADNEDRAGSATKKTAKTFLVASHFYEVGRGFGEDLPREMEERAKYARWKAADIVKAINEGRVPIAGPPSTELLEKFETDGPAFRRMSASSAKAIPQQLRESDEAADGLTSRRPSTVTTLNASLPGAPPSASPMPPTVPKYGLPSAPFANPYASIPHDFPAPMASPPQPAYRPPVAASLPLTQKPSNPPTTTATSQHPSMTEILDRAKALSEAEKATRYALSSVQFEDIGSAISNLERALSLLQRLAPK